MTGSQCAHKRDHETYKSEASDSSAGVCSGERYLTESGKLSLAQVKKWQAVCPFRAGSLPLSCEIDHRQKVTKSTTGVRIIRFLYVIVLHFFFVLGYFDSV